MRPTFPRFAPSAAHKINLFPPEVYPLLAAMGVACVAAGYALSNKFISGELRTTRSGWGTPNRAKNAEEHH